MSSSEAPIVVDKAEIILNASDQNDLSDHILQQYIETLNLTVEQIPKIRDILQTKIRNRVNKREALLNSDTNGTYLN